MIKLDIHKTTLNTKENILVLKMTWDEWIARRVMANIMMSLKILKMMTSIDTDKNIKEKGQNIDTSNMNKVMEFMKKEMSCLERNQPWYGEEKIRKVLLSQNFRNKPNKLKKTHQKNQGDKIKMIVKNLQKSLLANQKLLFQLWDKIQKVLEVLN